MGGFSGGTSAQENYIHMGQDGLYYRTALRKKKSKFVDLSSQEIVNQINAKQKKFMLWPLSVLLLFIPGGGILQAMIAAIMLLVLVDKKRKTTVLIYDFDEDTQQEIQRFYHAISELASCSLAWHVSSQAIVGNRKYNAGANQAVRRVPIRFNYKTPKHLKTNIKVPAIPVGSKTIYFFPDRILIYDKKFVEGLSYDNFKATQKNHRFIERGAVPRDGTVVDRTWQYVNKSGGPDKRFANNRQLPVLMYSEIHFTSNSGLNELIQFSKQNAGVDWINKVEEYKRNSFLSNYTSWSQSPGTNDQSASEVIRDDMRDTSKEDLHPVINIVSSVDVSQKEEHFMTVQPLEVDQDSQYAAEKIIPDSLAKRKQPEPYAMLKEMKKISEHHSEYTSYYSGAATVFYKQALFMKDFTDNYDEIVPFETYYTTYEKMNDAQLRTYFTWRTKVRQGIIEEISLSYVFCYIFELLNDVGAYNPNDAIEKLVELWESFHRYHDKLDTYLRVWIRDYYVAHKAQLPAAFIEYSSRFPTPYHGEDIGVLEKAKSCSWDDLRVIEVSSSFRITNGQFYKSGNQEIIEKCTCFTIKELAKIFKNRGVDFRKMFFEKQREKIYSLYQGAVHLNIDFLPVTVELNAFETMKYNSRGWYREYISVLQYRAAIGYILKLIEVKMRQHFGYKRNLQVPNISVVENCFLNSEPNKFNWQNRPSLEQLKPWKVKAFAVISSDSFETAIACAISDYCKSEHIVIHSGEVRVVKPIEIDMSKLKDIEREYIETAEKLITEEFSVEIPGIPVQTSVPVNPVQEIDGMTGLVRSLTDECNSLLFIILKGEKVPPNSELLIETINEIALEAISDNLIDDAEGVPYIYDDYVDELKLLLGGQ